MTERRPVIAKILSMPLHTQILIALILGLLAAFLTFHILPVPAEDTAFAFMRNGFIATATAMGDIFLRLLRMVIVPLVATSIITGVAAAGDPKNLGRLGLKTFAFYMTSSLAAIFIGLSLSNIIQPGVGVDLPDAEAFDPDALNKPGSIRDILMRIIPMNPVAAWVEGDMLSIIFFSIAFGAALTRVSPAYHDAILKPIDAAFHVMMKLTSGIIALAPLGVFGLIVRAVGAMDMSFFYAIGWYMVTIALGLTMHLFIVLPLILWITTKRNPRQHFVAMADAMLTAFSTSSSSATLPVTMESVEQNIGVKTSVSSFVLPLGSTVNMDGSALYECAGALFIAQVLGADLTVTQQIIIVITALLASIGAAGIPSAGLVMIFIVLDAVGLQGPQVGVIVGTMLAVDRPLDMFRTVVNVFSDSIGTTVVAHSEGAIESKE